MVNKKLIIKSVYVTVIVFIAHYFSNFLEEMVVAGNKMAWAYLFLWYTLFIYIGLNIFNKRSK